MMLATLQSSAVLILTLGFLLLLRRQSASVRHTILSVGLVSALVAPFIGPLLPELPQAQVIYSEVRDRTEILWNVDSPVEQTTTEHRSEPSRPGSRPTLWIWLAGVFFAVFVLVAGGARVAVLLLRSTPVRHADWLSFERDISRALHLRRRVRLLYNDRCILGTWGLFRPKVLIPREAEGWSEDRIRIVLTHEDVIRGCCALIRRCVSFPICFCAEGSKSCDPGSRSGDEACR